MSLSLSIYIYIYIYTYICYIDININIYIYIYIYVCTIYIYIYRERETYMYTIYIYIYREREICFLTGFQAGSGRAGLTQKGHKYHTCCGIQFKCAHFATNTIHLVTLSHDSWLMFGNCGTSVTTPFVLTQSGR